MCFILHVLAANIKNHSRNNKNRFDIGAGSGKDSANFSEDNRERPIRSQTCSAINRKRRRFNDLEGDSTPAESEDEFLLSNR